MNQTQNYILKCTIGKFHNDTFMPYNIFYFKKHKLVFKCKYKQRKEEKKNLSTKYFPKKFKFKLFWKIFSTKSFNIHIKICSKDLLKISCAKNFSMY